MSISPEILNRLVALELPAEKLAAVLVILADSHAGLSSAATPLTGRQLANRRYYAKRKSLNSDTEKSENSSESDTEKSESCAHIRAGVLPREELSNIPPEKATLSTPKGETKKTNPSNRGSRLPDDWKPNDDGRRLAVDELGSNAAAHREFAKFQDHWRGKPGSAGRKIDWDATWRNWVRTAADRAGSAGSNVIHINRTPNGKPSVHDAIDDIIRGFDRPDGDMFAGGGGEVCQNPHGLLSQG